MQVFAIDEVQLSERLAFRFAGACWSVKTNSERLHQTLTLATTDRGHQGGDCPESTLSLQIHVNEARNQQVQKPHFRGQDHIVVATFGPATVFVFDLLRRHVSATVTLQEVCDVEFWREAILPIAIGLMGATIGVLPVHCASFAFADEGVLIAGASGAGKSTLSAELCQARGEVEYLADDWTYLRLQHDQLMAHGVGARIKLLPDAVRHFSALSREKPRSSMNGEVAYEVYAGQTFAANVRYQCRPRWLIFLERAKGNETIFTSLSREHACAYLEESVEVLPAVLSDAARRRAPVMAAVANLPAWKFSCGGSPAQTADELRRFVSKLQSEEVRG
jgi:hypothetical protein